ncbi:transglycosylase SLT domain-containing protein [Spirochaeta lutea]|uniref:transglycosylase SLT domain-containing protein n=1 Tax=Spirochaeta lutea TaxID=1480694 RepID=UPI00138E4A5D|nr:transglycosylase SLT domain-containing protein [Spirochaeta lutea]
MTEYQAQHRLYRKSRLVTMVIPSKETIWMDDITIPINLEPYLSQPNPALALYRNPDTRDLVIDFFIDLTGSEEVALTTLYYSDRYHIPALVSFSLAYVESRFLPEAVNANPGSYDRGVFQLNNLSFPHLRPDDFFNIDVNVFHGIRHLDWCVSVTDSMEEALAVYNAGLYRVKNGQTPESTQRYVRLIMNFRSVLAREFSRFMSRRGSEVVFRTGE